MLFKNENHLYCNILTLEWENCLLDTHIEYAIQFQFILLAVGLLPKAEKENLNLDIF